MNLNLNENPPEANVLRGTVTNMSVERATGFVLISVQTANLVLKSRMPVEKMKEEGISPTSEVTAVFSPKSSPLDLALPSQPLPNRFLFK